MKILLITHKDLDGVGCAVLGSLAFHNAKIEYKTPYDINDYVSDLIFTSTDKKYDKIIITDLSISKDLVESLGAKLLLLDHHQTALELSCFNTCIVDTKECGTSLFYSFLITKGLLNEKDDNLKSFVQTVKEYDLWLWQSLGSKNPLFLNILLEKYGIDKFKNDMVFRLLNERRYINALEMEELEEDYNKMQEYINDRIHNMITINNAVIDGSKYTIACCVANKHISILGNAMCLYDRNVDFAIVINNNKLSFRTIKEDLRLDLIAKFFNGGGHRKASGAKVDETKFIFKVLDLILDK